MYNPPFIPLHPATAQVTREYTLTAIMKLSTRFDPSFLPRIKHMV